jgi:hypothetical protein
MFLATDTVTSPWYTVESEEKKRSRINVIAHLLSTVPYQPIEPPSVEIPARPSASGSYQRPPKAMANHYVPDVAATVAAKARRRAKQTAARGTS